MPDGVGSALMSAIHPEGPSILGGIKDERDKQGDEDLFVEKFNVLALTVD